MRTVPPIIRGVIVPLALGGVFCACSENVGQTSSAAKASCEAGTAEIQVGDGYVADLCGCAEASGTTAVAGQSLTCTVSVGTTVFFEFVGSTLEHQILSTGVTTFPASPIWDPQNDESLPAYPVTLTAVGNYTFQDAFESNVGGTLVAM